MSKSGWQSLLRSASGIALGVCVAALSAQSTWAQQAAPSSILLDEVVVQGAGAPATGIVGQPPAPFAGGQVGSGARLGVLGNRSILETPFNQTSFTDQLIRDQQARSLQDIVLNDPSVRNDAPPYSERDSFFIRGFSVTNLDTTFDGLQYLANPRRSFLEGVERVEILKGPSTFANGGVGRVGGTINLVPKRADDDPLTRLTTTYISESVLWPHLDIGRRFGPGGEFGVRGNISYRAGDTELDRNDIEVGVGTLGLDYRGERLRATLDVNYSDQKIDAPTSLFNAAAPGVAIPSAPDGSVNTSNAFEFIDSEHRMIAGRVEYDILDNTTLYAAAGVSRYREDFLTTSYTIGAPALGARSEGDALAQFGFNPQEIRGRSGEVGVRSQFDTGPVGHQLNVVASSSENKNNRGRFNPATLGFPSYRTNIYNPAFVPEGTISLAGLPRSNELIPFADLLTNSVAVSDTLSFIEDRVQLTVGGRFQEMRSRGFNTRPGNPRAPVGERNFFYEESEFTPAFAAVVRATENLSFYANYVESLTEGPIAPATALNSGEVFAPFVNEQKEIGVKYDFGGFAVTTSLFEITQQSGFTDPATRVFGVDGLQRNRGLELNAFGEVVDGLRLLGGVTVLDAELAQTAGGRFEGNEVPGVAEVTATLYAEYDTPWIAEGLTLNGRVIASGSTFYDQANTQEVDGWTRLDLGLRYAFTGAFEKPVEIRANVENVLNESYWASSARGFLAAGAPRTFTVAASFDF